MKIDQIIRFWRKVQIGDPDACWLWKGGKKNAYGIVSVRDLDTKRDERFYAHRLAFTLSIGPIPPGINVLHSCDAPLCCNPSHLFLGTQTDNLRDMRQKNRGSQPPLWNKKNIPDDIASRLGQETDEALARRCKGISRMVIARIRKENGIPSYASRQRSGRWARQ